MRLSRAVGAQRPSELVFTSGATEADNAAILGIIDARAHAEHQRGNAGYVPHFVTSAIEHDAVLSLVPLLRERGCAVDIVKPNRAGFVAPETLRECLRADTALVSIMWANNEIGAIQDVRSLARVAHEAGALFHTDATQAFGKIAVDVNAAAVDAASFSAHKVGGPKGVGALYLRTKTPFTPLLLGGGQEQGRRSGTQNVAGVVGFAAAADALLSCREEECARLAVLRDRLYDALCVDGLARASIAGARGSDGYLPNIVSLIVPGFESETLILQLDLAGFAVSGGSACSTGSLEPSHVLSALGISRDEALCSLRLSMGPYTAAEDIEAFVAAFRGIVTGNAAR